MMKTIDFYFDFANPNAYLSHKVMKGIKERTGAEVNYIPVLLGGIFKATNNKPPMEQFLGVKNKNEYQNLEIQRFIELLHNGELPNDWRYDIIHSLLDSLLNNYDVNNEDEAYEHIDIISDSLVNVYNYGLAKWLCEDVSRGYFDSSSEISSIYEVNHSESIYGVIMKRQYEEIYTMASKIVDYCS